METLTALAATVTTLIFSEAFKEGGKALGKGASDKITQLVTIIKERLKKSGTDGLLTRAEKQPTDANIAIVEAELVTQMNDDRDGKVFVQQLEELLDQLKQVGFIRQVIFSNLEGQTFEVEGEISQTSSKEGSTEQIIGSHLKVDGSIKFRGNITQQG